MARPKKVSYVLIKPDDPEHPENRIMYAMLQHVRDDDAHKETRAARIALAWSSAWKSDVDGNVVLGKCKKASDLDRELHPYDFVIMLNCEWWQHPEVTDAQREALLDHELMHAAPKMDEDGDQMVDQKKRLVWRMRKHDIEEFVDVVKRRGIWKRDLERMAIALRFSKQKSLLDLRDEIVEAGVVDEAKEVLRRVAAGENGADVVDEVVKRSLADDKHVRALLEHVRSGAVTIEHAGQSVTLHRPERES